LSRHGRAATVARVAREDGQATVELLGIVPVLLVAGLVVWQLVLVGHTAWMSAHAARAAARAELVGADAPAAARSSVPERLESGLEVEHEGEATTVRVPVPVVHTGWRAPIKLVARASLETVP
jgi:pilus assembly protein CpaE